MISVIVAWLVWIWLFLVLDRALKKGFILKFTVFPSPVSIQLSSVSFWQFAVDILSEQAADDDGWQGGGS